MIAITGSDTLDLKAKISLTFAKDKDNWKIVHEHISPRL
jgi:ketosteroid isomerase-like protein